MPNGLKYKKEDTNQESLIVNTSHDSSHEYQKVGKCQVVGNIKNEDTNQDWIGLSILVMILVMNTRRLESAKWLEISKMKTQTKSHLLSILVMILVMNTRRLESAKWLKVPSGWKVPIG